MSRKIWGRKTQSASLIFASTVALLTDEDLSQLGVVKIGDRALLRKRCRDSQQSKRVSDEVKRIMSPSTSRTLGYSTSNSSLIGQTSGHINRKPKRKSTVKLLSAPKSAKKGKVSTAKFQKKLIVFKFMGTELNAPDSFTRADSKIAVRGLLPPIPVEASEADIRKEICDVIRSSSDFDECSPNDFQFIDMSGKQASVPKCKQGFVWDGRAVKELAGSGCLYVRFVTDVGPLLTSTSGDDSDLPQFMVTKQRSAEMHAVDSDPSMSTHTSLPSLSVQTNKLSQSHVQPSSLRTLQANQPSTSESQPSTSGCQPSTSESQIGLRAIQSTSIAVTISSDSDDANSPALQIIHEKPNEDQELAKLAEVFPTITPEQVKFAYSLPKCNKFNSAVDCFTEGPSLESLRALLAMQLVLPLSESPYIRVDVDADDEEMVGAALAYYKHGHFNKEAPVRISMRRQPGIDTGSLRRQLFSVVLGDIALSRSLQVFEGPIQKLRPSYRASILSSGLLSTVGTMIGHSFVMDGYGFPYLSEYCFYYLAGNADKALTSITLDDVGEQVKLLVTEIERITEEADVKNFVLMDELAEMMEKCGCDVVLTIKQMILIRVLTEK